MKQADLVTLAREDQKENLINQGGTQMKRLTVDMDDGDEALRRDLAELMRTPMYTRLYEPFWGQRFDIAAQAPDGANVLVTLQREWRRLMEGDERVKPESAKVDFSDGYYIFSVESALTGELLSVKTGT